MREMTRILHIHTRELWLAENASYFGREWRPDAAGGWRLDPEAVAFGSYDEAIEWVNAPRESARRMVGGRR